MTTLAAVAIFIEVTRAPTSVAIEILEKHGGNLTNSINFYFLQEDTHKLWSQEQQQQEDDYDLARALFMSLKDLDDPVSPTAERNNISNSLSSAEELESCQMILREYRKRPQVFNIAVRMPDGRRIDRYFLKTDKLKDLFDFVDIVGFRGCLPGTYRLVKQFPRRGYGIEDSSSTFDEVGLSNHEALYVEKI